MIDEKITDATIARKSFVRAEYNQIKHPYAQKDKHRHPECEIFLLVDGRAQLNFGDSFFTLQPGSLVITPPNLPHRYDMMSVNQHTRIIVEFNPDYQAEAIKAIFGQTPTELFKEYAGVYDLLADTKSDIQEILLKIVDECVNVKELSSSAMVCQLIAFMIQVKRHLRERRHRDESSAEHVVNAAITLIHSEIYQPLTLDDISRELFVNKTYLSRIFKAHQNISVQSYISLQKVFLAKELLARTGLSVDKVSKQVGYASSSYFSRVFQKETGMSPSKYRQYVKVTDKLENDYHNRSMKSQQLLKKTRMTDENGEG